jgi:hypothetical protein
MDEPESALTKRVEDVLKNVSIVGPLSPFNLRFETAWAGSGAPNTRELVLVLLRHVECVEDWHQRDFRMAAVIDPDHPQAKDNFVTYVLLVARDLVARAFIHEVDEGLRVNGVPLLDPHPGGDFGIRGNYVRWPLIKPST